jgi:hypothetical protein
MPSLDWGATAITLSSGRVISAFPSLFVLITSPTARVSPMFAGTAVELPTLRMSTPPSIFVIFPASAHKAKEGKKAIKARQATR